MKTKSFCLLFLVPLLAYLGGCKTNYGTGAKLAPPNQLQFEKGFKVYEATTRENGKVLLIEPNSLRARQKEEGTTWACKCGVEGTDDKCKIITTEGSDTAECRGDCFCGFKKGPKPTSLQIVSKKLIKATLR